MDDTSPTMVRQPLVLMYEDEDRVVTVIYPSEKANCPEAYGLLVCDLVRHVAAKFDCHEDTIFDWVDRERRKPTTTLRTVS